jgi:hypothetical protein
VEPRAGLYGCGKSPLQPGFDHCTVQHTSSRYTDYAIPAHVKLITGMTFTKLNEDTHFLSGSVRRMRGERHALSEVRPLR